MPVRLDSLLSEPQETQQQVVHLADKAKNIGYPWDMPKEDISFHLKTTEYKREPVEAGIETFMNKMLQGIASFALVSKGLDIATQIMPKEKWDELGEDALETFKAIPRLFFGSIKIETDFRGPLTPEELETSEAATRLGGEILRSSTRIPAAIIRTVTPEKGKHRLAEAAKGLIAPEETPTGYTGGEIAKYIKPDFWMLAGILGAGVELGAYALPYQGKLLAEFNKDKALTNIVKNHLSPEGQDFVTKYPKFIDLLKQKFSQVEVRPGVTLDAYMSSRPFRMAFRNLVSDLRSEAGQAALPKRISIFKQSLTQDGYIINLIAQGAKVPQDLIPRLGNMIEEQRSQIGRSIFEPDTGDIEEMTKMAAEGKLKLNKSEDVFSEEAHKEFYPAEEYAKVKDYAELQQGGGISPQDQKQKPLAIGDPVKYENKFGILQDIFDDGIAQIKTIVGIKEVSMWELNKVNLESLTKKEQSLIESIKGEELFKPEEEAIAPEVIPEPIAEKSLMKLGDFSITQEDLKDAVDQFTSKAVGFSQRKGKTLGFDRLLRTQQEKKLWEDMTPEERKAEFKQHVIADFKEAAKEMGYKPIDYILTRALDPLDPMAGVYKILLKKAGATIKGDKIKLPPKLEKQLEGEIGKEKVAITDKGREALADKNVLLNKVSNLYRENLTNRVPNDVTNTPLWTEQMEEQIQDPERYGDVAEEKNYLGLKIGDKITLDDVEYTVVSVNKKQANLISPQNYGGWHDLTELAKTKGITVPKEKKEALTLAIRLKDGSIISDSSVTLHSAIIANEGIDTEDVRDVGIIDDAGNYQATKFPDERGGAPLENLPEVPKEAMEKMKGLVIKETPTPISKEELTPEIMDKLYVSERELATKRVLEGKSIKQTAKELDEDPEDTLKSEKWLAEKIPELKAQLEEAMVIEEAKLAEEFEQEMATEMDETKKALKGYLAGKFKPELASQGEYQNLKHLSWLFAKKGQISFTPDQLIGEISGMGFPVETVDDVRELIKSYFSEEIWEKAERELVGIDKKAKTKLKNALAKPPSERKKIQDEMRLEKLSVIADQLTKLAEVAPRIITPKQIAYIHVLKEKHMLTDQQFARLKKIFTDKKSLKVTTPTGKLKKKPVTKEEAAAFIEGLKEVVPKKPIITGQPPVIPRTKALVSSDWAGPFNDLTTFQAAPLSGLDPIRAAELVDGKPYGPVSKYIVEPAQEAERKWKNELKVALDNLTKVSKGMKSNSDESELIFKFIENTLGPQEETKVTEAMRQTANYLNQVYDDLLVRINEKRALLNKVPIRKRQDYITHVWELSLLDELYKGLSNIPDDVVNIPSYAKSNSPFFKFALARLGGKEFRLDAIAAFESYVSRAYPVIYNTDVLKSARPLVDRLPSNAYKYFSQYLDEAVAMRPAQADKLIPKPLLRGISWLRRTMGKGAILGNFASAFNQLFTLPNSMSAIGPKYVASAVLKIHRDEWRAFTEAHSKVLQSRIYEIDFDPTLLSKVDNALGFLIHIGDKEMVRIAWGAQFEKSLSKGRSFGDAIKDADGMAFRTQSGFNATDLPPAFRSKIAGSFLQFQNTVNNGLNFLRFDLGKEEGKRGKMGVFKAALIWLGTLLVLNKIYRELGIPTPIDDWSDIFPLISMAEYGPPVTFSAPWAILDRVLAKTPQDQNRANKALYRAAFLFLPAGNQARKTLEGIWAASQGGKFDKRGRLLIPIRGIPEVARAVVFGPYGTKAGQAYIKRGFKPETGRNFIRRDNLLQRSGQPLKRAKILTSGQ